MSVGTLIVVALTEVEVMMLEEMLPLLVENVDTDPDTLERLKDVVNKLLKKIGGKK
ncbi:MAG: hypothetical protein ACYTFW_09385 [Planctomycetota bacterium]|jgi:hypothetical protein